MKNISSRILCLILALVLFALMAAGSGASNSESSTANNTAKPEASASSSSSSGSASSSKPEPSSSSNNKQPKYTISDETLVDNEFCTFRITKAEVDSIWGFTLKVFCENKTEDKTLMFSVDDVVVNGYMADPFWASEVAAGKKSNEEITFSSTFDTIGITSADEIIFNLRVYDNDDWAADSFVDESFTVYPTGLSHEEVVYPERRSTSNESIVIDNEYVTFIILENTTDNIWGYTLKCYIENKTDKNLMFSWDDVSVNGYMLDPYWAREVAAGMRSYSDISFSSSEFEKNSITDVEEIEYSMKIYDYDNWMADHLVDETFKYVP